MKVSKSIVEKHRLIIGKPVVSDSIVQVRSHTRDLADLEASVLIHCRVSSIHNDLAPVK